MSDPWIQAHLSGATSFLRSKADFEQRHAIVQEAASKSLPDDAKTQVPVFSQRVVGIRLRVARKTAGFSQRYLARKAGLSSWQLSRIERGHINMSLQTFARLVDSLGASASELLFGERGRP